MIVRLFAFLALAAASACNAEPQEGAMQTSAAGQAPSGLKTAPLEIRSGTRTHRFTVELAITPEEQSQGLMYRKSLAPDAGMLFPFSPPRPASFWMKNTLIPLDMIFVRPDGTIGRIAANTVPHSLETVSFGEPAAAVLEIAGGRAAQLGLSEGDRVSWPSGPR